MDLYSEEEVRSCYDDIVTSIKKLIAAGSYDEDNQKQHLALLRSISQNFKSFHVQHTLKSIFATLAAAADDAHLFQGFLSLFRPVNGVKPEAPKLEQNKLISDGVDGVIKTYNDAMGAPRKSVAPEAPVGAPFGRYAFAEHRNDVPDEKDTKIEKETYKSIMDQTQEDVRVPKHVCSTLVHCLKSGFYRSVLREPTSEYAYRGLTMSAEDLSSTAGIPIEVIKSQSVARNGLYVAEDGRPWATRRGISMPFAAGDTNYNIHSEGMLHVLFRALVANNNGMFLDLPPFHDGVGKHGDSYEGEIIGLGDVKYDIVVWSSDFKTMKKAANEHGLT